MSDQDMSWTSPVDWKICPTPSPDEASGTKWGNQSLPDEPTRSKGSMKQVQIDGLGGQGKPQGS